MGLRAVSTAAGSALFEMRASVQAATTGVLPNTPTYDNGTTGVGATLTAGSNTALAAQDGITLIVGDRLLVKNQASGLQNGIYDVSVVGSGSVPWVLTRSSDANSSVNIVYGMFIIVDSGTTLAGTGWALTGSGAITVGTTALTFTQLGVTSGVVTSVGLALPAFITVSNSPVTSSGTLTGSLATQLGNLVLASSSSGATAAPAFRALVNADLPVVSLAKGGTGADLSATGGTSQVLKQTSAGTVVSVAQLAASDLSNGTTGSGAVVLAAGATLSTPTLGAATVTTLNQLVLTPSAATVTMTAAKKLSVTNTLTLGGTDASSVDFGGGGTVAYGTIPSAAAQSDQETGTSTTTYVSPGRQQFHASAAKAWIRFNGAGTPTAAASYNITSITDVGTGLFTLNFTTAFSTANYGASGMGIRSLISGTGTVAQDTSTVPTASTFTIAAQDLGTLTDFTSIYASFFGDQ